MDVHRFQKGYQSCVTRLWKSCLCQDGNAGKEEMKELAKLKRKLG